MVRSIIHPYKPTSIKAVQAGIHVVFQRSDLVLIKMALVARCSPGRNLKVASIVFDGWISWSKGGLAIVMVVSVRNARGNGARPVVGATTEGAAAGIMTGIVEIDCEINFLVVEVIEKMVSPSVIIAQTGPGCIVGAKASPVGFVEKAHLGSTLPAIARTISLRRAQKSHQVYHKSQFPITFLSVRDRMYLGQYCVGS